MRCLQRHSIRYSSHARDQSDAIRAQLMARYQKKLDAQPNLGRLDMASQTSSSYGQLVANHNLQQLSTASENITRTPSHNHNTTQAARETMTLNSIQDSKHPKQNPNAYPETSNRSSTQEQQISLHPYKPSHKKSSKTSRLASLVDLEKLQSAPIKELEQIWTTYHTQTDRLSAIIPIQTYRQLYTLARRYPCFVLPLPKESGHEMYVMQWSVVEGIGSTESLQLVMTPLAQYQVYGANAEVCLVLQHYVELVESHGVVLMRGEVAETSSGQTSSGQTSSGQTLTQQQAHVLVVLMEKFYLAKSDSPLRDLLHTFTNDSQHFSYQDLIKIAMSI